MLLKKANRVQVATITNLSVPQTLAEDLVLVGVEIALRNLVQIAEVEEEAEVMVRVLEAETFSEAPRGRGRSYNEGNRGGTFSEAPRGRGRSYNEGNRGGTFSEAPRGRGRSYGENSRGGTFSEAPRGRGRSYGENSRGGTFSEAPRGRGRSHGESSRGRNFSENRERNFNK